MGNGRRLHKKHWVNQSFKTKAAFQVQYEHAKAKARMAFKKVKRELETRTAGGEIITVGWQGQGQLSCVMDATINGLKKAIDEEHHHQLVLLTKFEAKWLAILLFLASVVYNIFKCPDVLAQLATGILRGVNPWKEVRTTLDNVRTAYGGAG